MCGGESERMRENERGKKRQMRETPMGLEGLKLHSEARKKTGRLKKRSSGCLGLEALITEYFTVCVCVCVCLHGELVLLLNTTSILGKLPR